MRKTIVTRALLLATLAALLVPPGASAAENDKPPLLERPKWRFEFDNDILTGGDDAFSAGFSVQRHSPMFDTWDEKRGGKERKGFALWIGRHIPGLGDGGEGGRIVRRATGLGFLLQTPEDIENPDPQPLDVPWAGTAGIATAWSAYDNRSFGAFQIYVGCMGPCSGAEQIQKFVHDDLGLSDSSPQGWDNQLDTEALFNVNYALRYKVAAAVDERYQPGRFAGDFAIGGQVGAGNYFTFAEAQLELRWGWGLPMGFTHIPDPLGRGIMIDPAYVPPGEEPALDRTRFYFSLVPRYVYFEEITTLEGGETENGGFHPGIDYDSSVGQILAGFHIARKKFAAHLTLYYFPDDVIDTPTESSFDWVNISLEWRF
jgi:hypothetical protein